MKKAVGLIVAVLTAISMLACSPTVESSKEESEVASVTIMGTSYDDAHIIRAVNQFGVQWFNMRSFYQDWFKNYLEEELITFTVDEEIESFYAYYVLNGTAVKEKAEVINGTMGEGYIDGYNFLSKDKDSVEQAIYVKYNSVEEILPEVQTADGANYSLDLCVAQKTANSLAYAISGEIIEENVSVYVRFPLKIDGEKITAVTDYSVCEEYENDKELLSLKGKFVTAKKTAVYSNLFIGELIDDEFFFEVIEDGQKEFLYRYSFSTLGMNDAKELFLPSVSEEEKQFFENVFVDDGQKGTLIDFTLIKNYLSNR